VHADIGHGTSSPIAGHGLACVPRTGSHVRTAELEWTLGRHVGRTDARHDYAATGAPPGALDMCGFRLRRAREVRREQSTRRDGASRGGAPGLTSSPSATPEPPDRRPSGPPRASHATRL
jgi:hypothetical protein